MKYVRQVGIAGCVFASLFFCGSCSETEQVKRAERSISVKTSIVTLTDQQIVSTFTGSLEGEKQANLVARLSEAVGKVNVKEGQWVEFDKILLELDKSGASSQYNSARSLFRNSEKNLGKMKYLYEEGAVSESDYDAAKTDFEVNQANFNAITRLLEIHSPIAGVVTSVDVSEGELVKVGQKLATVATTERLRVRFGVNPTDIGFIRMGAEVEISGDAVDAIGHGTIEAIASSADPSTRTFQVEALIDNADGLFLPGVFVRVKYIRERLESVVAVSQKAVLSIDNNETAFVVENGVAHKRLVTTGADLGGLVVIESGLKEGDTLVTLGQDYLDDGSKVNVTATNGLTK